MTALPVLPKSKPLLIGSLPTFHQYDVPNTAGLAAALDAARERARAEQRKSEDEFVVGLLLADLADGEGHDGDGGDDDA